MLETLTFKHIIKKGTVLASWEGDAFVNCIHILGSRKASNL